MGDYMKKSYLFIAAMLLIAGCSLEREVRYEVTGTAALVDITIENSSGGTSQYSDVAPPWAYDFSAMVDDFIYVSAQNATSTGSVTATIKIDGDVYKSSTSSGAYVIATASGSVE